MSAQPIALLKSLVRMVRLATSCPMGRGPAMRVVFSGVDGIVLEFRILGPFEVVEEEQALQRAADDERYLLAALLPSRRVLNSGG